MSLLALGPRDRNRVARSMQERGYSPLRVYRKVADITQRELALRARVSQQAVACYELSRMIPRPAVRRRLAKVLRDATGINNIRPENLFSGEGKRR